MQLVGFDFADFADSAGNLHASGLAIRSVFPYPKENRDDKPFLNEPGFFISADARISELQLQLPEAPKPGGIYTPAVQVGDMLYVSGHGPVQMDGSLTTGQVGTDLTEEQGQQAARQVGLTVLATLIAHLGSLDKIERVVKVLGMVNASADFRRHPLVINGFSQLMVDVFGDAGRGARSTVGMGSLPGNIPVEVEAIFQLKS